MKKFISIVLSLFLFSQSWATNSKSFDGTNDKVTINTGTLGTENSACMWIDWLDGEDGVVVGAATTGYFFYLDPTNAYYSTGNTNFVTIEHGGLSGWDHLCLTRSDFTVTWYLNGASLGSDTLGSNTTMPAMVAIGSYGDDNFPSTARLSDVRIWNAALSATDILNAFHCRNSRPANLIASFSMLQDGNDFDNLTGGTDGSCSNCPANSSTGPATAWCGDSH